MSIPIFPDNDIPLVVDPACPENTMFLMPDDVKQGMDLLQAAGVMRAHDIISQETYDGLARDIADHAIGAAREGRIGVIKLEESEQ